MSFALCRPRRRRWISPAKCCHCRLTTAIRSPRSPGRTGRCRWASTRKEPCVSTCRSTTASPPSDYIRPSMMGPAPAGGGAVPPLMCGTHFLCRAPAIGGCGFRCSIGALPEVPGICRSSCRGSQRPATSMATASAGLALSPSPGWQSGVLNVDIVTPAPRRASDQDPRRIGVNFTRCLLERTA
jgi:hypothetical protein